MLIIQNSLGKPLLKEARIYFIIGIISIEIEKFMGPKFVARLLDFLIIVIGRS